MPQSSTRDTEPEQSSSDWARDRRERCAFVITNVFKGDRSAITARLEELGCFDFSDPDERHPRLSVRCSEPPNIKNDLPDDTEITDTTTAKYLMPLQLRSDLSLDGGDWVRSALTIPKDRGPPDIYKVDARHPQTSDNSSRKSSLELRLSNPDRKVHIPGYSVTYNLNEDVRTVKCNSMYSIWTWGTNQTESGFIDPQPDLIDPQPEFIDPQRLQKNSTGNVSGGSRLQGVPSDRSGEIKLEGWYGGSKQL